MDQVVADARADRFDGLVLPGGTSPDKLRLDPDAVAFVGAFVQAGKPIAAICHGPWMLIDANGVAGRTLTSWPSLQSDLRDAGTTRVDGTVVADGTPVTSRNPGDLLAFCEAITAPFSRAA